MSRSIENNEQSDHCDCKLGGGRGLANSGQLERMILKETGGGGASEMEEL